MVKQIQVKTAKQFWTENGAGKSKSMKDHVSEASAGKPKVEPKK
jgi:hypothetical protein